MIALMCASRARKHSARVAALACVIGTLGASGCMSGPMEDSGIRVGDETLAQFKTDVTTEAWLVAILGPPTSWSYVNGVENTKVFRYATVERASGVFAGLLGKGSRTIAVTYFIITDGVVTRYWADRAKEYTLLGKPVESEEGAKQSPE